VPGSSKNVPGTQGLPEIVRAKETAGSDPELTWDGKGRFGLPLNRLFFLVLSSGLIEMSKVSPDAVTVPVRVPSFESLMTANVEGGRKEEGVRGEEGVRLWT